MRAQHRDAKTILLTHHQFFSAYEDGAIAMRAKLMPVAVERPVDASDPAEGLVYEYRDVNSKDPQPWIAFGFPSRTICTACCPVWPTTASSSRTAGAGSPQRPRDDPLGPSPSAARPSVGRVAADILAVLR
jgi:hypothetical protein